ncbi:4455_t:CDS:2, partial [Dentiscutata erythropus]
PPQTKEAYWYRDQFESLFPGDHCTESVVRWIPRRDWGCPEDPSGRAQSAHNSSYSQDDLARYNSHEQNNHILESQL